MHAAKKKPHTTNKQTKKPQKQKNNNKKHTPKKRNKNKVMILIYFPKIAWYSKCMYVNVYSLCFNQQVQYQLMKDNKTFNENKLPKTNLS